MRKLTTFLGSVAVIVLIASQAAAVDPVVYLPFEGDFTNQGTGGSLYDGFLVQGTTGSYTFAAGPTDQGQCLDIDNDGSLKTDGTFLAVDYTLPDQGTIALWYYAEPWYNYQTIYDNGTASSEHWEMWIYDTGMLRTRPNNSHPEYGYNAAAVQADMNAAGGPSNWYHIAYSWDRNDTSAQATKLYIDGNLADSTYMAWIDPGPSFYLASGHSGNTYGNGAWDELRIYDAVLSASEIGTLASADPVEPPTLPNPVIAFDFEGDVKNSGTGGAAYDGTLVLGTNGSATYVEGAAGQCIDFDCSDPARADGAYVAVPYTMPEEGTISLWYKADEFYNYQSLIDNSCDGNDWEMWIYESGSLRMRVDGGQGDISVDTNVAGGGLNDWINVCYSWSLADGIATLYLNGRFVGSDGLENQEWIDPGTEFYIAGGNAANMAGVCSFDNFKVFEERFDLAQVQLLYATDLEGGSSGDDLEGDLDGDGFVGSSDLDIVRGNWGQTVSGAAAGDPSGDGIVGSADLDIVRANWGATSSATAVPEPSVFVLLALGVALGLLRNRK